MYTEDATYGWNYGPKQDFMAVGREEIREVALGLEMKGLEGWEYPYQDFVIDRDGRGDDGEPGPHRNGERSTGGRCGYRTCGSVRPGIDDVEHLERAVHLQPQFCSSHQGRSGAQRARAGNRSIQPGAAARDESKEFPAQLVKRLGQQDLMGISVPEEFGGLGLSTRTQLVAIEEVARTDAALASIYTAHYLGLEPILVGGSEEQKHRWLPQLASGELLAGFALTEPDAGSDIASMRTVARREDDGWHLSGSIRVVHRCVREYFAIQPL